MDVLLEIGTFSKTTTVQLTAHLQNDENKRDIHIKLILIITVHIYNKTTIFGN